MTAAVSVRDVFYGYPTPGGTVMALRGLSLTVAAGERVVVHGPNGSGKSTLIRLLLGDEPPSSGHIAVGGTEMSRLDAGSRRLVRLGRIGYVDQHAMRSLIPEISVLDNVAMQLALSGATRKVARQAAERSLGALGLSALSGRATTSLSGGEAQRVSICAAVAHRPTLILADEPTGELDADAADDVYDLLRTASAAHDACLVMVSHDHRAERVADRVVRIRDGRLSEQWDPGGAGVESLVLDDRGWVRIPADLRGSWPPGTTLTVVRGVRPEESITLLPRRPTPADLPVTGSAPPVPDGRRDDLDKPTDPITVDDPITVEPDVFTGSGPNPALAPVDGRLSGTQLPVAQMSGVQLAFGDRTVLADLDLDVVGGAVLVVAGPSGSGKSSLLRILAGLADPDRGTVTLGGVDLSDLDRASRARLRRRLAGVSLQRTFLAETLTVRENLQLARAVRTLPRDPGRISGTADELGIAELLDQPVRLLSGGERQRVGIARCLAVDRSLLILDEPTSQQDEASAEVVVAALRRAADHGAAIIAATHDPAVLRMADQVRLLGR